jgi:outer membrane lipoprotein-sorting protein
VEVDAATILKKTVVAYNQPELSGEIEEAGVSQANTDITIFKKIRFWLKNNKSKMEVFQLPNTPRSSQTTTIGDGTTMWAYDSNSNNVMKVDLAKLPEDLRSKFTQQGFFGTKKMADGLDELLKLAGAEEKVKDGKKYYYVTIKNLDLLEEPVRRKIEPNNQVKKIVLQVDANNYQLTRVETYGDSEQLIRWTDFKNMDTKPIDDSLFVYTPPAGAHVSDMTEETIKMFEGKKH